jgi:hypothetical protein
MAIIQSAINQPAPQLLLPAQEAPPPSSEQIQATDIVFSRDEQTAAGALLGLWTGGMLVHDFLQDTCMLAREAEAEEREKKGKNSKTT